MTAQSKKSLGIFWDIENIPIPVTKSVSDVAKQIRDFIADRHPECGFAEEFFTVCDVRRLDPRISEELDKNGVIITHVKSNAMNDRLKLMDMFVDKFGSDSVLVVITSDINFAKPIRNARHKDTTVVLIHGINCSNDLNNSANECYLFEDIIKSVENVEKQKHLKSAYLKVSDLPEDKPLDQIIKRLSHLSVKCGGKPEDVNYGQALIRFDSKEDAQRCHQRMAGENCFGHKIQLELIEDTNTPTLQTPVLNWWDIRDLAFESERNMTKLVRKMVTEWKDSQITDNCIVNVEVENKWELIVTAVSPDANKRLITAARNHLKPELGLKWLSFRSQKNLTQIGVNSGTDDNIDCKSVIQRSLSKSNENCTQIVRQLIDDWNDMTIKRIFGRYVHKNLLIGRIIEDDSSPNTFCPYPHKPVPKASESLISEVKPIITAQSKKSLGIFWDIENIPIPVNKSASDVAKHIRDFIADRHPECGFAKEFFIACDVRRLEQRISYDLINSGIVLIHTNKDVDIKLQELMFMFIDKFGSDSVLIVIKSDKDFMGSEYDITHKDLTVVLIHGFHCSEDFKNLVIELYSFEDIIISVENVTKSENQMTFAYLKDSYLGKERSMDQIMKQLSDNSVVQSKKSLGIFWDIENIPIPVTKSASGVAKQIRDFIADRHPECGFAEEFFTVCDVRQLDPRISDSFDRNDVVLYHNENLLSNQLQELMDTFVNKFGSDSVLVVITSDTDFARPIRNARRKDLTVVLIHGLYCSENLKNLVNESYLFENIIECVKSEIKTENQVNSECKDDEQKCQPGMDGKNCVIQDIKEKYNKDNRDIINVLTTSQYTSIANDLKQAIFWDIEYCNIDGNESAYDVAQTIITFVAEKHPECNGLQKFYCICNINDICNKHINELYKAGVNIESFYYEYEKYKMTHNIDKFIESSCSKSVLVLITGDKYFHSYIAKARKKGISVMLLYNDKCDETLKSFQYCEYYSFEDEILKKVQNTDASKSYYLKVTGLGKDNGNEFNKQHLSITLKNVECNIDVVDVEALLKFKDKRNAEKAKDLLNNNWDADDIDLDPLIEKMLIGIAAKNLPMAIYWDVENCSFGNTMYSSDVAYQIMNFVKEKHPECGYRKEFYTACDVNNVAEAITYRLNNANVTIEHVSNYTKNIADEKLIEAMDKFIEKYGSDSLLVLISGDSDFISTIKKARIKGINVLLLYNNSCNEHLRKLVDKDECYSFEDKILKHVQVRKNALIIKSHYLHVSGLSIEDSIENENELSSILKKLIAKPIEIHGNMALVTFKNLNCLVKAKNLLNGKLFRNKYKLNTEITDPDGFMDILSRRLSIIKGLSIPYDQDKTQQVKNWINSFEKPDFNAMNIISVKHFQYKGDPDHLNLLVEAVSAGASETLIRSAKLYKNVNDEYDWIEYGSINSNIFGLETNEQNFKEKVKQLIDGWNDSKVNIDLIVNMTRDPKPAKGKAPIRITAKDVQANRKLYAAARNNKDHPAGIKFELGDPHISV